VLRTVANRLQMSVRPTDIVARLGGDEFGVVCPGCSREELAALAAEIHELLCEPIGVHGAVVAIGASIGAAVGHDSVAPLLEKADRALYGAKERGRGTVEWAD
jgi:diguanylate cyclase (GGDEF)-like protein